MVKERLPSPTPTPTLSPTPIPPSTNIPSPKAERSQIYQDISYSQLVSSLEGIKRQIPNRKEATEVHKAFVKKIIPNWLKAFHLTPEMVDLSKQELKALDNYFYANLLMLECKNAAVRVSRKTWSEIESRMLMPFREQT